MSEIKVNKISPRAACGTVTLGDSGDTFTIPAGATINNQGTATNFGATGSASWTTTVKTGDFTAVAGEGYFVDTSSGEIDVTLPAGTAGAVVAVADYANNFGTNNVILVQNGSDKIGGSTNNAKLATDGIAVTLIFIDSTKGWIVTDDGNQSSADTNPFLVATGGTETTSGNCKIHTFTGPGTFTVCKVADSAANNQVSYLVVGGGGGGGAIRGAGGGAGGFREDKSPVTPYTASPLDGAGNITVSATGFPITVGAGGTAGSSSGCTPGTSGGSSTFSTITSAGGGKGGMVTTPESTGSPGASGGGGTCGAGGTGNTPPVSPAQGSNGGSGAGGPIYGAGGGGGATAAGANGLPGAGTPSLSNGGAGGAGASTEISGSSVARAGGGGGSYYTNNNIGAGGLGGSGGGGPAGGQTPGSGAGTAGTANTGGGGGGGWHPGPDSDQNGGAGGSGVVIIRYKFQ